MQSSFMQVVVCGLLVPSQSGTGLCATLDHRAPLHTSSHRLQYSATLNRSTQGPLDQLRRLLLASLNMGGGQYPMWWAGDPPHTRYLVVVRCCCVRRCFHLTATCAHNHNQRQAAASLGPVHRPTHPIDRVRWRKSAGRVEGWTAQQPTMAAGPSTSLAAQGARPVCKGDFGPRVFCIRLDRSTHKNNDHRPTNQPNHVCVARRAQHNSVASAACYRTVRDIILEAQASNPKMAVVVSAMGGKPKVCLCPSSANSFKR